jgi:hypothetical protein
MKLIDILNEVILKEKYGEITPFYHLADKDSLDSLFRLPTKSQEDFAWLILNGCKLIYTVSNSLLLFFEQFKISFSFFYPIALLINIILLQISLISFK